MTNLNSTGKPGGGSWWVLAPPPVRGSSGGGFDVVSSPKKPAGNVVAGPFPTKAAAEKWVASRQQKLPNPVGFITGWLGSIGGMIASGLEQGLVSIGLDAWNVIVGPLEVLLGAIIALIVLAIYFKNDVLAVAKMAGMAMAG